MVKRLMIQIDEEKCTGCGLCITNCEEGALAIIDGKAIVVSERFCDGLGACIGHCPEDALTLIEVETVEFDEEAAMEHVRKLRGEEHASSCCPTIDLSQEASRKTMPETEQGIALSDAPSYLQNFPVKLKLMAPNHPALRNASLLLSADCTGIAYPTLHEDFMKGKTVILVCPKFEDYEQNILRLTQIFAANEISDVTVLVMEVPCCSGLVRMVKQASIAAKKEIQIKSLIIGVKGQILSAATA
ncbi:MAG: 4Fe-4S binding protein [Candidatus Thorarchaeota archaeon]|nr:4Fe-4S binding protein [Candidatus Thorarchaeota archaeon]